MTLRYTLCDLSKYIIVRMIQITILTVTTRIEINRRIEVILTQLFIVSMQQRRDIKTAAVQQMLIL